jgi:hypothetical protein
LRKGGSWNQRARPSSSKKIHFSITTLLTIRIFNRIQSHSVFNGINASGFSVPRVLFVHVLMFVQHLVQKGKAGDPSFEVQMGTSGKNETKAKPIGLLVLGSLRYQAQCKAPGPSSFLLTTTMQHLLCNKPSDNCVSCSRV